MIKPCEYCKETPGHKPECPYRKVVDLLHRKWEIYRFHTDRGRLLLWLKVETEKIARGE